MTNIKDKRVATLDTRGNSFYFQFLGHSSHDSKIEALKSCDMLAGLNWNNGEFAFDGDFDYLSEDVYRELVDIVNKELIGQWDVYLTKIVKKL